MFLAVFIAIIHQQYIGASSTIRLSFTNTILQDVHYTPISIRGNLFETNTPTAIVEVIITFNPYLINYKSTGQKYEVQNYTIFYRYII